MKSSGKVKSVLTGKVVSFAHGSKSAIDKKAVGGRQSVSFLGLNGDEQGDLRFHGGVERLSTYTLLSTITSGWKSSVSGIFFAILGRLVRT